jgi:hypothetical protein
MAKISFPGFPIEFDTPCGPISIEGPSIDVPFPPDFSFFPLPFPPKIVIPLPDCSILKHTDSVADPEEDSSPDLRATKESWVIWILNARLIFRRGPVIVAIDQIWQSWVTVICPLLFSAHSFWATRNGASK